MNEDWDSSIDFVLKMEGGYTFDPNDPGGETNFGISKKSYPKLDIKNITVDQAKAIYRTDFWNACSCDNLPWTFALAVFDSGVNQGTGTAIKLLQMALGVTVDGIVGSNTIAAAFKAGKHEVKLFLAHRLAEYERDMVRNNKLQVFDVNWGFRVVSVAETIFSSKNLAIS